MRKTHTVGSARLILELIFLNLYFTSTFHPYVWCPQMIVSGGILVLVVTKLVHGDSSACIIHSSADKFHHLKVSI
jgi:hypothetical protein